MRVGVFAISMMLLAGCFRVPELPLLSEVDLAEDAAVSDLAAADVQEPKTVLEELQSVENLPEIEADPTAKPEKPRRGLFGLFRKKSTPQTETDPLAETEPTADASSEGPKPDVEIAALAPPPTDLGPRKGRGLFGTLRPKTPPANQVKPGTQLPYGEIGVACGIRGKALGKEVDRFPAKGKGYRLYDSDPSLTQLRTHYLTGFSDGCPRQFTASLALLASPLMHEQLLVAEKGHKQHSNAADKAFEKLRRKICRVGRGKPCPENRVAAMEKSMAFVTTYEHFGDNARWEEILLHKGEITANSNQTR